MNCIYLLYLFILIGRNELNTNNYSHSYAASNHSSSISSQASSTISTTSTLSVNQPKRLNENDIYVPRGPHPLEMVPAEDSSRYMHRGPITSLYTSANNIASSSSSISSAGERKRSTGQHSGKKYSKDRERSDGSIYYSSDKSKKDSKVNYPSFIFNIILLL